MNVKSRGFIFSLSAGIVMSLLTTSLQAGTTTVIVDDSFADGDFAKTGALDTPWWTSSSSSGKEITTGALGLVTGTSGRGIHTIFPTQTLDDVGDTITAYWTFTTPTTIDTSGGNSAAFRVGLFDDLGRTDLNANVSASSGSPNEAYGWGAANGFPDTNGPAAPNGPRGLPGFMFDMDVYNMADVQPDTDLNFRKHSSTDDFIDNRATGRLMATTGNQSFTSVPNSGPDAGYFWASDTEYSGSFSITRSTGGRFILGATRTGPLGTDTLLRESTFDSEDFSFLGFHANSRKFGSTNSPDDSTVLTNDNGINFSNIRIVFSTPEPTSFVLLLMGLPVIGGRRRS